MVSARPIINLIDVSRSREAQAKPQRILTRGTSNPKTAKGRKLPYRSALIHFAPADLSGYEACIYRSKGCTAACLNTAGRGRLAPTQAARIRKTKRFFEQQDAFMAQLVREVESHARCAERDGLSATLRLNGTSDIDWTRVPAVRDGVVYPNLFVAFPEVQFYDYTKRITALRQAQFPNYHLTFSLSEGNDRHATEALERGFSVAVVMRVAEHEALPATWDGIPVIDGTEHDFRFLDPRGVIVGLRPKGKALRDDSGFVREIDGWLDRSRDLSLGRLEAAA